MQFNLLVRKEFASYLEFVGELTSLNYRNRRDGRRRLLVLHIGIVATDRPHKTTRQRQHTFAEPRHTDKRLTHRLNSLYWF
jgi:hypothetical protein